MSRIRSTHPAQWTDEAFVSMSAFARLLAIAVRNEADDHGIFEWKPLTLKMRLFAADDVDVVALLMELENHHQVMRYEIDGKALGAIRNFMVWQRPKKPSFTFPATEAVLQYVGHKAVSDPDGSEPDADEPQTVPHQLPTGGEKSPQRKDVGGREERAPNGALSETKVPDGKRSARKPYPDDFEAAWSAYPTHRNMSKAEALTEWTKLTAADRALVLPSIPSFTAYCRENPTYTPIHFNRYLKLRRFEGHAAGATNGAPAVPVDWPRRLNYARNNHEWATSKWGPPPGQPGCRVPEDLLQPGDGVGWNEMTKAA